LPKLLLLCEAYGLSEEETCLMQSLVVLQVNPYHWIYFRLSTLYHLFSFLIPFHREPVTATC